MAENRGAHSTMVECMSWIYTKLSKHQLESAEECARALVLTAIVERWANQTSSDYLSKEWLREIAWSTTNLDFEDFDLACEIIANEDLTEFSELTYNLLSGNKIEHLSSALSIYDTTLDINLDPGADTFSTERRDSGTHYTPWDVAKLMCRKVITSDGVKLLDPAVGTGTFLLAYIDNNPKNTRDELLSSLHGGDKNRLAVIATRLAIWSIGNFDSKLKELLVKQIVYSDFLTEDSDAFWTAFGINSIIINPPYVTHKVGNVNFKNFECKVCGNLWTLFVERSVRIISNSSNPQMVAIVPTTIATSERCKPVRRLILETCQNLSMMHIDVVPGYLFKQGKTEKSISSANNTRAISPRVTIFSVSGNGKLTNVYNTIFLRWHDDERGELLKLKPKKVNIKAFTEDIFPMGGKKEIDRFLKLISLENKLSDLIDKDGAYPLYIVKTSRYYISAARTDLGRPNMMKLNFSSKNIRDAVHASIVSNLFFWYWRVVGNGFQLSNKLVLEFPVPSDFETKIGNLSKLGENLLDISEEVAVEKTNANKVMTNLRFDDRNQYIKLIDKELLSLYKMSQYTSEELARFKSPYLKHKIPGEFMIGERDRHTVFDYVFEHIKQIKRDVNIEELYEFIRQLDKESGVLSDLQKQRHEQRTGPKEAHWRHDLRNSLSGAKSKGVLVNPKPEYWGMPRPSSKLDQNAHEVYWQLMIEKAENMIEKRERDSNNRIKIKKKKEIIDPSDKSIFVIESVSENEIIVLKIKTGRSYVISRNLVSNKVNHLLNCGGVLSRPSFHKWKPLSAGIVHLHPLLEWDENDVRITSQ
jgi:hypothetical protein